MVRCELCEYWEPEHSGQGWCKRHAPAPVTTTGLPTEETFAVYGFWPMTECLDECGEGEMAARFQ